MIEEDEKGSLENTERFDCGYCISIKLLFVCLFVCNPFSYTTDCKCITQMKGRYSVCEKPTACKYTTQMKVRYSVRE